VRIRVSDDRRRCEAVGFSHDATVALKGAISWSYVGDDIDGGTASCACRRWPVEARQTPLESAGCQSPSCMVLNPGIWWSKMAGTFVTKCFSCLAHEEELRKSSRSSQIEFLVEVHVHFR
jgi:hypothetical protein